MTLYQWMTILGIPTLSAALITLIKTIHVRDKSVKEGVQALLRSKLEDDYERYYVIKGYAPLHVKKNYDNMYQKYHNLGKNGVMDDAYEKFMSLPTSEEGI